jgi:hypothetical protein
MRFSFKVCVAVLVWCWALWGAGWVWADGPRLKVPEATFDFGEVVEGDVVSHEFVLQNTGTEALQITDVRPG